MELKPYQVDAIIRIKNGSVLCGGVGSGKSITALYYYLYVECRGSVTPYKQMETPKDLFIITTAKKRDSLEWEEECLKFRLFKDRENSHSNVGVKIDSWNSIKKYKNVYGAFFIFDEQRVIGSGSWVKSFLKITNKNHWILLSATPGDTWSDYVPIFIANGYFKNRTEFNNIHCVYSRFSKYPKIERYVGEKILKKYRDSILVPMKDDRITERHNIRVICDYDRELYRTVFRDRWDPWENSPIEEAGKWVYLLRRVCNDTNERVLKLENIYMTKDKLIVFYNFDYELYRIKKLCEDKKIVYAEWNGHKHEGVPKNDKWIYIVQYSAGCEGWNCVETDTIVFYSQTYSYRTLEQASGRIDRINTKFKDLYYYHFKSNASIDLAIYKKLKLKQNFNENSFLKWEK